jgi:drug/metabolite transporter (DMT)-like permease
MNTVNDDYPPTSETKKEKGDGSVVAGVILIVLGILFLVDRYFPQVDFRDLWPFLLIAVGSLIIWRGRRQ